MVSIGRAVYLIAVVVVEGRRLHGQHHSQNTKSIELEENTEDFDIGALDDIDEVDDMVLTEEQWTALRQRKAIKDVTKLWTVGPVSTDGSGNKYPIVPYAFQSDEPSFCKTRDPKLCLDKEIGPFHKRYCRTLCNKTFEAFPTTLQPLVEKAIQNWKSHTCIEFVDITSEPKNSVQRKNPHVLFAVGPGCNSHVGMIGRPAGQIINIRGCSKKDKHVGRVHEIGHALGFFHEFVRSDRDEYIKYFDDNVTNKARHNFKKRNDTDNNYGIEYDYASIMHYGPYAGTIESNKAAMVPLDPVDLQIVAHRYRDGLSFRDKHLVNKMYNCIDKWESKCGSQKPRTCNEGYTGKHCTCVCPPHKTGSQCEMEKPGSNGDYYYEIRNQALNEEITTPMRLTVKVPAKKNVIFVKSVIPPVGKMAKVTFTTSNLYPYHCYSMFLYAVTDESDLEGKTLCDADLESGEILTSNQSIVINTILRGSWQPVGTTLWEAEITFHDITGCAATAATTTTTTTTTTSTITTPVTTSGYKSYPGWGWARSTCPWLEPYYKVESCEACTIDCTDNDECTAFTCWTYNGTPFCLLLECPLPVPEPNLSQSGMTGYVIE